MGEKFTTCANGPGPRENPPPAPAPGGFETLLRDKDRTLILSLLILLCDDDRDPGLLFALLFLLM